MKEWINWFRHASPYINQHRNKCMVFALSGEAIAHNNFINIIHDLALLSSLGIRIVLVLGARPQIEQNLAVKGLNSRLHKNLRVTTQDELSSVLEAYGRVRSEVEGLLSTGVINSPMHGSSIKVVSGNFISAKPFGVIDGVDYGWTGQVRGVDNEGILNQLQHGAIVIQTAQGYAVTGEAFNLSYETLATEVAQSLSADKLIFLGQEQHLALEGEASSYQLSKLKADELSQNLSNEVGGRLLSLSSIACGKGVNRAHILGYGVDGAILEELFTRDGVGVMVSNESYDEVRPAHLSDLNGISELIEPLEAQGVLVKRSRELLETELDAFIVNVRDNAIIACAALYPYADAKTGELSCFAVSPEYRKEGRGDHLLDAICQRARSQGLERLFVLTTQTEHWFIERGFKPGELDDLPGAKLYDVGRKSKVLQKQL